MVETTGANTSAQEPKTATPPKHSSQTIRNAVYRRRLLRQTIRHTFYDQPLRSTFSPHNRHNRAFLDSFTQHQRAINPTFSAQQLCVFVTCHRKYGLRRSFPRSAGHVYIAIIALRFQRVTPETSPIILKLPSEHPTTYSLGYYPSSIQQLLVIVSMTRGA